MKGVPMPNVIACYKWVLDEADVRINDDLSIDTSRAKMKISDYDLNAIQAASEAAGQMGGKAIGLSYGDERLKKSIKDVLSRGLDELAWIDDPECATADSAKTAAYLAAGVRGQEDVQLVVCGDGSSDMFSRQTAPRVAAALDWPVVTSVAAMSVADGTLSATRQTDAGMEEVEVALPAVVAVLPEMNEPPIPSLRQIMQAGKKPNAQIAAADLSVEGESKVSVAGEKGYAMDRKNVIFDGEDENCVTNLMAALRKEGVL